VCSAQPCHRYPPSDAYLSVDAAGSCKLPVDAAAAAGKPACAALNPAVGPNAGLGTCADLTVASFMAASCNYTGLMHWYELFNRLSVACRCQSRASGQPHDGILHYTAGLTHHCCSCWGETAVLLGCRCGKMMQSHFHDMPSMSTGLTVTVVRRARTLH
jgi:hypothetical protein